MPPWISLLPGARWDSGPARIEIMRGTINTASWSALTPLPAVLFVLRIQSLSVLAITRTVHDRHSSPYHGLPSSVAGPVLLRAFARFASICLNELIVHWPQLLASFRYSALVCQRQDYGRHRPDWERRGEGAYPRGKCASNHVQRTGFEPESVVDSIPTPLHHAASSSRR
jgi:hypothetical protein